MGTFEMVDCNMESKFGFEVTTKKVNVILKCAILIANTMVISLL